MPSGTQENKREIKNHNALRTWKTGNIILIKETERRGTEKV